ncbi:redox-regulated ATPase YchF [candidate division KSB1 bacterium]
MKIGIVGLKNSGKSTIFSALTGAEVEVSGYKKTPNLALIKVPDIRLDKIAEIFPDKAKINSTIDFVDIVETAEVLGKGFSTDTINQLKYCDAILAVIRAFKEDTVPSPLGKIDIRTEYETVIADLIFSDIVIIEGRVSKLEKNLLKKKDENEIFECEVLKKCLNCLDQNRFLNTVDFSEREDKILRGFQFLTYKPVIFVINKCEEYLDKERRTGNGLEIGEEIRQYDIITICGKLEKEINELDDEDADEFRKELGVEEKSIDILIQSAYKTLNLISFFTIGNDEVRAWAINKGIHAKQAAGKIHTDFEKGFIKAEAVCWEDLIKYKSMGHCREEGVLRTEGKDYTVNDGDVILFKFNI